jgi:seryl-tRNA synthetase
VTRPFTVRLDVPATDMVREEIVKRLAFFAAYSNPRFSGDGSVLEFDGPGDASVAQVAWIEAMARDVQRSLRTVARKVVRRGRRSTAGPFAGGADVAGIHMMGAGRVTLEGLPLGLHRYFDGLVESLGARWHPRPLRTPVLIPSEVLARCGYLRSFPNALSFVSHLAEDPERIERFRERHEQRATVDEATRADLASPDVCLSPAVCYHVYHLETGRVVPPPGQAYAACSRCFRYEGSSLQGLRRLWEFTMREIVFVGGRDWIEARREDALEAATRALDELDLAFEIRTASDPFFVAPDSAARTYFQLTAQTKYEIAAALPDGDWLAIGSVNGPGDFFGRAFEISVEDGRPAHSACIGFGLERCAHAFLAQHGGDPAHWPAAVRRAALSSA